MAINGFIQKVNGFGLSDIHAFTSQSRCPLTDASYVFSPLGSFSHCSVLFITNPGRTRIRENLEKRPVPSAVKVVSGAGCK